MPVVNIAFSSGIDSAAMALMALKKGFRVQLHVINVSGISPTFLFEANQALVFKGEFDKLGYTKHDNCVEDVVFHHNCPWPVIAYNNHKENIVCNSVTQQLATVLGMAHFRRMNSHQRPGVWIGWNKEDSREMTFDEMDFSEAEYKELLTDLPGMLGRLGNGDNLRTSFRAPLWNMNKREIYDTLPPELRECVIANGRATVFMEQDKISYNCYEHKLKELHLELGIGFPEHWETPLSSIPAGLRIICGHGIAADVGLPPECNAEIKDLSVAFSRRHIHVDLKDLRGIETGFKYYVDEYIELVKKLVKAKETIGAEA